MHYANLNKQQQDMTASPDKYPQGLFRDKGCRECQSLFKPQAPSHLYCSQDCQDRATSRKYLKRVYDIDLEFYEELLLKQDNKCALCESEGFKINPNSKSLLVVDHCHTTGKVRGLLCHNCNRGLGLFQDNAEVLKRASEYVK